MRALHLIPSVSPVQGGPSFSVKLIAHALTQVGVSVDIATTDDDGPNRRLDVPQGWRIEQEGYSIFYFRKQTEFYKISLPFSRWLARHITDYDVVSVHALFSYTSTSAAFMARRARVPYLVVPHGVLNRWGLENRRPLLKALSLRLLEKPLLRAAAAMYYTSRAEKAEAEQLGITARPAVIPHGIDPEPFRDPPDPSAFTERFPQAKGRTLILFLSRLDPKKGLDLLLPVFAQVRQKHPSTMLVLAGTGPDNFVSELHAQVAALGLTRDVLWTGFLAGTDKLAALSAATLFILPSYSENFGIALLEAMAAGLPCITTFGVALWEDLRENHAGLIVPAQLEPLSAAVERLLSDAPLRMHLGENARRLVAQRFTLLTMGTALKNLYHDILSRRHLPGT